MQFDPVFSVISIIIFLIYILSFYFIKRKFVMTSVFQISTIDDLPAQNTWRIYLYRLMPLVRILAIISLCIALSRPQIGNEIEKVSQSSFAINMLLDRSSSMGQMMEYNGEEFTRLDVVKKVFEEFVLGNNDDLVGRSTDLISLSSFAQFVDENYPLTFEHKSLVRFAKQLRLAQKFEDGTMIGDSLYQTALKLVSLEDDFKKYKNYDDDFKINTKIIILLTDGQQTRGGLAPLQAAEFLKNNQIKVYTIAIVPEKNIPQKIFGSFSSFFGNAFNQQIDTGDLEELARITGGQFAKITSGESLKEFYSTIDQLEKTKFVEKILKWDELFPQFLLLGLILLLTEYFVLNFILKKI